MVDRLQSHGLDISYQEVLDEAGGTGVGRPHIAAVLVQNFYTFALNDALAIFGPAPAVIQLVVISVAAALIWYSRLARSKGWTG